MAIEARGPRSQGLCFPDKIIICHGGLPCNSELKHVKVLEFGEVWSDAVQRLSSGAKHAIRKAKLDCTYYLVVQYHHKSDVG